MSSRSYWPNRESWQHYWSYGIVSLIATIQLLFSFAILGIQIVIVVIGTVCLLNGVTPRYVMGFVCWGFFMSCWISTFCVTCCNRSSVVCATYVLVKNILAFIFSAVLIDFDRKFIDNPAFDYNPSYPSGYYPYFDYNPSYSSGYYSSSICYNTTSNGNVDFWYISQSLSKGQLAGAVIILVTSLIYVGIYIYVYIRALSHDGRISTNISSFRGPRLQIQPPSYIIAQPKSTTVPQQPGTVSAEPPIDYIPQALRSYDDSQTIICYRCGATIQTVERF